MSDINQQMLDTLLESNRALIASNQSISESVRANSETNKATNETVKELTVSVRELITTERERVLKDKNQQEINARQEIVNLGNAAKWDAAHDVIVRAKRFHSVWDSVTAKIAVVIAIGLLALLGFNFR